MEQGTHCHLCRYSTSPTETFCRLFIGRYVCRAAPFRLHLKPSIYLEALQPRSTALRGNTCAWSNSTRKSVIICVSLNSHNWVTGEVKTYARQTLYCLAMSQSRPWDLDMRLLFRNPITSNQLSMKGSLAPFPWQTWWWCLSFLCCIWCMERTVVDSLPRSCSSALSTSFT